MTQQLQQLAILLPTVARNQPITCAHCGATRDEILLDSQAWIVMVQRGDEPEINCTCCDAEVPGCPQCESTRIEFFMHYRTGEDDQTGERARCLKCGWLGDEDEPI